MTASLNPALGCAEGGVGGPSDPMSQAIDSQALLARLEPAFGQAGVEAARLVELGGAGPADSPRKWLVETSEGRLRAVLQLSPRGFPGIVARGVAHARAAAAALGSPLASAVLLPLVEGEIDGASFALTPWKRPLERTLCGGRIARLCIAPRVLGWLHRAVARTARALDDAEIAREVAAPLERLAGAELSVGVRGAARRALERLEGGAWRPRATLAHMDLWAGNLLLPHRATGPVPAAGFHLIDWAGADLAGLPFYDLARLLGSLRPPRPWARRAARAHCRALGCAPADAVASALASVARLGVKLEQMPRAQWAATAEDVHRELSRVLPS